MRVEVTLVDPLWDIRSDVVIDADDITPTREVLDELIEVLAVPASAEVISLAGRRQRVETGPGGHRRTLYLRGEPLDPDVPIAESGIKEGSLIAVGDPAASVLTEPEGLVEIWVATGPGAGAVHRLSAGEATIGSDPSCVITVHDDRVPPVCVAMTVAADGSVSVRPMEDAASVLAETVPYADPALAMDREQLAADEDTDWPVGAQLVVGDLRLELAEITIPDAAIEDSPEPGWYDYNRPPRLLAPDRETQFALPGLPGEQQQRGIPWFMVFMPILAAIVMALVFRRVSMLSMAPFSPMMMIGNYLQSKKTGKLTHRQQVADYKDKK
ncbi:MAG: FtsK/SpoIIIE domain-containing protein, partial [Marmoricola sp.]